MPWFKVDDTFHSHPKVLACPPAAVGLWVIAGSWSAANLTEGFIPDHVLPRLVGKSGKRLAKELLSVGLWTRSDGGYCFRDWSDYQPSREAVTNQRRATAERQKRWRESRRAENNGGRNAVTPSSRNGVTDASNNATSRRYDDDSPSRPDRETSSLSARASDASNEHAPTGHRPEDRTGERETTTNLALIAHATDATTEEAAHLLDRVRTELRPRSLPGLLRTIAANGDLQTLLDEHRTTAAAPRISPRDEWMYRR